jgi:hypothetical protein
MLSFFRHTVPSFLAGTLVATLIGLWVSKYHEKLRAAEKYLLVVRGVSEEMLKMNPNDAVSIDFLDRVTESEQGAFELISSRTVIEAAQAISASIVAYVIPHNTCNPEVRLEAFKSQDYAL